MKASATPMSPAVVTITGAKPNAGVTVTIYQSFLNDIDAQRTGRTDARGRAVVTIPAPPGGWEAGMLHQVTADDDAHNGPGAALASFTMPKAGQSTEASSRVRVTWAPPKGPRDSVDVTITGTKPGEWLTVVGYPKGWTKEAPYIYDDLKANKDGVVTMTITPPDEGWPVGTPYIFTFQVGDAEKPIIKTFVVPAAGTGATTPKPGSGAKGSGPKDTNGGLAKTGW
ncbi:hypothetical protein [Mariniluteicoccus flavus]